MLSSTCRRVHCTRRFVDEMTKVECRKNDEGRISNGRAFVSHWPGLSLFGSLMLLLSHLASPFAVPLGLPNVVHAENYYVMVEQAFCFSAG